MNNYMLDIDELSASYGPIVALRNVSIHVNPGEIVALIGSNGAGKSTLLLSVYGNPRATAGCIRFKGQNITQRQTHEISSLGIALVPEGRRIFPAMSVMDNLRMGTVCRGHKIDEQELQRVFEWFPILKQRRSQRAGTLSGGEQQMLAIGRALMAKPDLLLLDEPSLGLAPMIVERIFEIISEIAASGMTIFLVEQNAHHALHLANRGYVLVNGEIKLRGSGKELLANPSVREAYLGGV